MRLLESPYQNSLWSSALLAETESWENPYGHTYGSWGPSARYNHANSFLPAETQVELFGVENVVSKHIGNKPFLCLDLAGGWGISAMKVQAENPSSAWTVANFENPSPPRLAQEIVRIKDKEGLKHLLHLFPTNLVQFWIQQTNNITFCDGLDMFGIYDTNPLWGRTFDVITETNGPLALNTGLNRAEKLARIGNVLKCIKGMLKPDGRFFTNSINAEDELSQVRNAGFDVVQIRANQSQIDYFKCLRPLTK